MLCAAAVRLSAVASGGTGEGGAGTGPMGAAQGFQPGLVLRGPGSEEWLKANSLWRRLIRGGGGAAGGFGFPSCSEHCVRPSSSVFCAVFVPHTRGRFQTEKRLPAFSGDSVVPQLLAVPAWNPHNPMM